MTTDRQPDDDDADLIHCVSTLVFDFARILVSQPDKLTVESVPIADGVQITLRMAVTDLYPFIGRKGKTVLAFRTILAAIGVKNKVKIRFLADAI